MRETLKKRWFILALISTMFVGIVWAPKLAFIAAAVPRNAIVAAVLLAMALSLKIDAMWDTLRRPGPAILAVVVNLAVVPILGFAASRLLIDDLALGFIIVASVPCTLASAAVWTRMAGGNEAISLLVTMITNISCFLVTPAWVKLLAGQGDASVDFGKMVLKLLVLVVLPIVVAQLLRLIPAVGNWGTANKTGLGIFGQVSLLSIVFVGAVMCGQKLLAIDEGLATIWEQLALMVVLAAAVHFVAWWIGYGAAGILGMARAEQLAVAFAGSQKTLMVGLAVAMDYGGMAILPMLAYTVQQLVIDTILADRFRKNEQVEA